MMGIPALGLQLFSLFLSFFTAGVLFGIPKRDSQPWKRYYASYLLFTGIYLFNDFSAMVLSRLTGLHWPAIPIILAAAGYVISSLIITGLSIRLYSYGFHFVLNKKLAIFWILFLAGSFIIMTPFAFGLLKKGLIALFLLLSLSVLISLFILLGKKRKTDSPPPHQLIPYLFMTVTVIPLEFAEYGLKRLFLNGPTFPVGLIITPIYLFILCSITLLQQFSKSTTTPMTAKSLTLDSLDLSNRERDVARCLVKGYTHKQTAAELFISKRTVDRHVENIYRKNNVRNKAEFLGKSYNLNQK